MVKFKTSTPRLFARFFLEVNYEEVKEKVELHESIHGENDKIDVVFFQRNPEKSSTKIENDINSLQGIVNFEVSDTGPNERQLLVEVII